MYQEYIGKTLTFKQAYFTFEGYNYAMTDVEEINNGTTYQGKVICVSNDPKELRAALDLCRDKPRALMQGKMEEIDVPEITLGRAIGHGHSQGV